MRGCIMVNAMRFPPAVWLPATAAAAAAAATHLGAAVQIGI